MKKILIGLLLLLLLTLNVNATEIDITGTGRAALSGYDIKSTREQEDLYMNNKAHKTKTELMHTQQIKEASRQAEKRKKEDKRLSSSLRSAVVTTARERAEKNAINLLLDRTLGANASKLPEVQEKFNDVFSQLDTYVINKSYSGEVIDNDYIAKAKMTVDETAFKELVSDLGIAINTQNIRAHSILIVMDEFFSAPSDMHDNVLTKEVTTYDYKYNEKDKETTKASYKDSNNASASSSGGYGNWYGAGYNSAKMSAKSSTSANYGNFVDYSKNESEFFQNIKEYAPKNPKAQNLNYTQPALVQAFNRSGIKAIDNDMFKSKYFKGKPISSDQLTNSKELEKYVKFAQTDAKADYFAIGVSYITDNGVDSSTGKRTCDGQVFVKIYSTQSGELIASGSLSDTSFGNSADQARVAVANKIGPGLGDVLSKQIENYYKKRNMYGSEYLVEVKGNFLPIERINLNKTLQSAANLKATPKSFDNSKLEYTVNYKGTEPVGDEIFVQLIKVSPKFNNYNYTLKGNQIIFEPLKGKDNL